MPSRAYVKKKNYKAETLSIADLLNNFPENTSCKTRRKVKPVEPALWPIKIHDRPG